MSEIINLDSHTEPYVTVPDLANYWQVHRATIYRDIAKGALKPHYLPNGYMRIPIQEARSYGKPRND